MSSLPRRAVIRVREIPGGTDPYGDPMPGTIDRKEQPGCLVAPRMSSDTDEYGRSGVVVGLTLLVDDPQADILRGDRIDIDGVEWDIEGEPGAWEGNRVGGLQVALKRAEG